MLTRYFSLLWCGFAPLMAPSHLLAGEASKPNVIFIAINDLRQLDRLHGHASDG